MAALGRCVRRARKAFDGPTELLCDGKLKPYAEGLHGSGIFLPILKRRSIAEERDQPIPWESSCELAHYELQHSAVGNQPSFQCLLVHSLALDVAAFS
jgi:hypothetical protein